MASTAEQLRRYRGPAILSYGFRPFFFLGAIWSAIAIAIAIRLPLLAGSLTLPIGFSPVEWHVHELLYGYLPAIAAGFLLTAVPNWNGCRSRACRFWLCCLFGSRAGWQC